MAAAGKALQLRQANPSATEIFRKASCHESGDNYRYRRFLCLSFGNFVLLFQDISVLPLHPK